MLNCYCFAKIAAYNSLKIPIMSKKIIITVLMAMALIAGTTDCRAQAPTQPYVDINSSVEREVTPNELYLRITINESDYKGKKSLESMQNAMLGVLKRNRIDIPECLTLNYMGSEVSYKLFSSNIKPKTQATYMLKLYDLTIMQQVIAELEKFALNQTDWKIADDNREGIRISVPGGWFLLRLSVHDPVMPINFERDVAGGIDKTVETLTPFFNEFSSLDLGDF